MRGSGRKQGCKTGGIDLVIFRNRRKACDNFVGEAESCCLYGIETPVGVALMRTIHEGAHRYLTQGLVISDDRVRPNRLQANVLYVMGFSLRVIAGRDHCVRVVTALREQNGRRGSGRERKRGSFAIAFCSSTTSAESVFNRVAACTTRGKRACIAETSVVGS